MIWVVLDNLKSFYFIDVIFKLYIIAAVVLLYIISLINLNFYYLFAQVLMPKTELLYLRLF